jgi:hypothetical protein
MQSKYPLAAALEHVSTDHGVVYHCKLHINDLVVMNRNTSCGRDSHVIK